MIFSSYHNHTTWSDGVSTLAETIDAARRAGLKELGISDHFALAPGDRRFTWALAPELLDAYVSQIQQAIATTTDPIIRMGLEVDYFPETMDLIKQRLVPYPFDYLIGSVHFVDDFAIDLNAKPWEGISQDDRNRMWRGYWQRLRAAAETGFFDIAGHFDLPKKFKFFPSADLTEYALAALDAIAAADMAIELNCSGWDKPVEEAYPSLFYLKEAHRRKIPLVINADAHDAADVIRNFERARLLAVDAGYTELVRFERRKRFAYPLWHWEPSESQSLLT
jgi:histidinol-phosphatase (PHP family)